MFQLRLFTWRPRSRVGVKALVPWMRRCKDELSTYVTVHYLFCPQAVLLRVCSRFVPKRSNNALDPRVAPPKVFAIVCLNGYSMHRGAR